MWKFLLADTADWKAVVTVIAVGRGDTATTVMQSVRVSIWESSTRPQEAERHPIIEATTIEVAAPSGVKRRLLYITITVCIPTQLLSRRPKTTSNTLFY